MKIGILSDSHGEEILLRKGIRKLQKAGAEALVHCGDLEEVDAVKIITAAEIPAYLTPGNMDRNITACLAKESKTCGASFDMDYVTLETPEGTLAALHGHRGGLWESLIASGHYRWICTGHTHCKASQKLDGVHLINPGALHAPRGGNGPTVALLDTQTDTVEFLPLDEK